MAVRAPKAAKTDLNRATTFQIPRARARWQRVANVTLTPSRHPGEHAGRAHKQNKKGHQPQEDSADEMNDIIDFNINYAQNTPSAAQPSPPEDQQYACGTGSQVHYDAGEGQAGWQQGGLTCQLTHRQQR
jgi:hypothetical protein